MDDSPVTIDALNVNLLRKFPVAERATLIDDSGAEMATDLLSNISIVSVADISNVRISYFRISKEVLSVVLSDTAGPVSSLLVHGYRNYTDYEMESLRGGVTARITTGTVVGAEPRMHIFSSFEQSGINDFCIVFIDGLRVNSVVDDESGQEFSGNVDLVFSGGIEASVDRNGRILLHVSDSLDKTVSSSCVPTDLNKSCIVPVIQSINGVKPTSLGEIAIVFE